jgi:hypothetical protein
VTSPSEFAHLLTADIIAKATGVRGLRLSKKFVQVVDEKYTLKISPLVIHHEYRVLQFLARYTKVPIARPVDYFTTWLPATRWSRGEQVEVLEQWHVVVMHTVPGKSLMESSRLLTVKQEGLVRKDVTDHLDGINSLIEQGKCFFPDSMGNWNPIIRPEGKVSSLDGERGRILELPIRSGYLENTTLDATTFISTMSRTATQPEGSATVALLQQTLELLALSNEPDNKTRFCHMDLHGGNIMVHNGELSGIIDWEMAGWYNWSTEVYIACNTGLYGAYIRQALADAWGIGEEMRRLGADDDLSLQSGHSEWKRLQRSAPSVERVRHIEERRAKARKAKKRQQRRDREQANDEAGLVESAERSHL